MSQPQSGAASLAAVPGVFTNIIQPVLTRCGCAVCQAASPILQRILTANNTLAQMMGNVLHGVTIVLGADAHYDAALRTLTVSHLTNLPAGSADKSPGDRLADSFIFESCNAANSPQLQMAEVHYKQDWDVKVHGTAQANIEGDTMVTFIGGADALPPTDRTGNMDRAMLRQQQATSAGQDLKTYLLDQPHDGAAPANDIHHLPTRKMYIYQDIENASTIDIQVILLSKLGVRATDALVQERKGAGDEARTVTVVKIPNQVANKDAVEKLIALTKTKWPVLGKKSKRPQVFVEILAAVQTRADLQALRASITETAFGFDDVDIKGMAFARR